MEPISSDIVTCLFDKLANVCGWFALPKKEKKDFEIAVSEFINAVEKNDSLSALDKAALKTNARSIIKEYSNQSSILEKAVSFMAATAEPGRIDDDWLALFMEHARLIYNSANQTIWGKVLAIECEQPGVTPKALLNILSIIDNDTADTFRIISKFCITMKYIDNISRKEEACVETVIDWNNQRQYYERAGLTFPMLAEQDHYDLIHFNRF